MAKILVADDNSNVQKTVVLALADLGVEVVSVNNGEAAVKKMPDVSPDLVLADIFMPVRNGYEVCEFVKNDSRFTHVPVVLLVGAFDPLDEREAQRVGADGILKKPFVPPDPLITMVKTLLDRSMNERLVTVASSKPAVSAQAKGGAATIAEKAPLETESSEETPQEEIPPPVSRLSFGEGERPIAFEQLLEPPVQEYSSSSSVVEPVDAEQIFTNSRDTSLGEPEFWKTDEPELEQESEESTAETDLSPDLVDNLWSPDQQNFSAQTEVEPVEAAEPLELVRDDLDQSAGQTSPVLASTESILQDPAKEAQLNVQSGELEDLAANPIEWMATAPPLPPAEVPTPSPDAKEDMPQAGGKKIAVEREEPEGLSKPVSPETSALAPSPLSVPAPLSIPAPPAPQPQTKITIPAPEPAKIQPPEQPSDQSPEDTAPSIPVQDWSDLAASIQPKSVAPIAEAAKPSPLPAAPASPETAKSAQSASTASVAPDAPNPALVEAVVQRVMDKMRPQVVDIITKEFLRPIVQALVHREIEKP